MKLPLMPCPNQRSQVLSTLTSSTPCGFHIPYCTLYLCETYASNVNFIYLEKKVEQAPLKTPASRYRHRIHRSKWVPPQPPAPARPGRKGRKANFKNEPERVTSKILIRDTFGPEVMFALRRKLGRGVEEGISVGFGVTARDEYLKFPSYKILNSEGLVVARAEVREEVRFGNGSGYMIWLGFQKKVLVIDIWGREKSKGLLFSIYFEPYWSFSDRICKFHCGQVVSGRGRRRGTILPHHPRGTRISYKMIGTDDVSVYLYILFGKSDYGRARWVDPNIMVLKPRLIDGVNVQVGNIRRTSEYTLTVPQKLKPKWKGKSLNS